MVKELGDWTIHLKAIHLTPFILRQVTIRVRVRVRVSVWVRVMVGIRMM